VPRAERRSSVHEIAKRGVMIGCTNERMGSYDDVGVAVDVDDSCWTCWTSLTVSFIDASVDFSM
jgi:hypothetical protein